MKTILVVPCFNEAQRLEKLAFEGKTSVQFLFVNDGSTDNTLEVLKSLKGSHLSVLNLKKNMGKSEAVRIGMLEAASKYPDAEWIGFWDADLATPLDQIEFMLGFADLDETKYDAIFGSRVLRLGSHIDRLFLRHLMGRVFVTYASFVLGSHAYDSQCGAKLFRSHIIEDVFSKKFISRWFFDLEIIQIMSLRNQIILECPIQIWKDIDGSKIKPISDGIKALFEILKIRKEYGKISSLK